MTKLNRLWFVFYHLSYGSNLIKIKFGLLKLKLKLIYFMNRDYFLSIFFFKFSKNKKWLEIPLSLKMLNQHVSWAQNTRIHLPNPSPDQTDALNKRY